MTDVPAGRTARYRLLFTGYTSSTGPGVAATVSLIEDGDLRIVVDPGMVPTPSSLTGALARAGLAAADITDVVLSHHHPDNIMNVGLFMLARVHDHKAVYRGDQWTSRDADGVALSDSVRLLATPGHSDEDVTVLAGTPEGVVAFAGDLWWRPDGPADDPVAPDRQRLRRSRERVLACADVIVPGHGPAFVPGPGTVR
ncbi:MBL fold metallo-hydrolase [Dactylosporangium sp. NPDC049140]|uniref:MBL fold metallo-hydrolase n=1 Tax=Dactylosporangium sp. NPDC049140 TaxID=3155647 RepID=UPI0033EFA8B3